MNNKNTEKSIGIHFIGLENKERSTFDRIIAFNVTHGLLAHNCEDLNSSDLIILSETALASFDNNDNTKVLLVLTKDSSLGDIQVAQPLLITRAMKALENAIKLIDQKVVVEEKEAEIIEPDSKKEKTETIVANEEEKEETSTPQEGHHALVIDDSAAIRKQLELELRDAGITSDFAESGEVALEKIKNTQYDLIFLDIIMPGIDGYETCKTMRATAEYKKTPIIMLSGKTSPLDEVQGVIAGATTYLTKPVKSSMLQETLSRVTKWINNYSPPADTKRKDSMTA